MNETKYRAWTRLNPKMRSVMDIGWSKNGKIEWVGLRDSTQPRLLRELDLMQFTGKYDNTKWEELTETEQLDWVSRFASYEQAAAPEEWVGREIYRGDVLRILGGGLFSKTLLLRVDQEPGGFMVRDKHNQCPLWSLANEDLEIVGNIFANPELKKTVGTHEEGYGVEL